MKTIEEHAYQAMQRICAAVSARENRCFEGCFAADMLKENKKNCVYPCFCAFDHSAILIIKVNAEFEAQDMQVLLVSQIKYIQIKKMFLSKNVAVTIVCNDDTSFTLGVPPALEGIPTQQEAVQAFLQRHQGDANAKFD